jgi:geranylgeranyl pyrophosphate synthase
MIDRISLVQFVDGVHADCRAAVADERFCADQSALLGATVEQLFHATDPGDWGQPLGLFYAIYRACDAPEDAIAFLLGRFTAFYIASADLFDDVQDEDLAGKPHEAAGPAIATNSALTLLTLALDALGEASLLERRQDRKFEYLRLFNKVSLVAVAAQHQDLMGQKGAQTRAEVEHMHRGKTSSIALVCECAALAGGADAVRAKSYYQLGEELAAAIQVIDDVRDLVAKEESVDLVMGKSTYPLACFHETASETSKMRLAELLAEEVIDLDSVRQILEQSGAFDECAVAVERHRARILELLLDGRSEGPHVRLLGEIVNHLASALYEPPELEWNDDGAEEAFAQSVSHAGAEFAKVMGPMGFGRVPAFHSWHLPTYLYVPAQKRIYFGDLSGLPEEVLPFHAGLLDFPLQKTAEWVKRCVPFLIAHELAHAWRDQMGLLTKDAWHEEHIANSLAFAYVSAHLPEVARDVLFVSKRIVESHAERLDGSWQRVLERCTEASPTPQDYDCSPKQAALVHAKMILRLQETPAEVAELVAEWFFDLGLSAAE